MRVDCEYMRAERGNRPSPAVTRMPDTATDDQIDRLAVIGAKCPVHGRSRARVTFDEQVEVAERARGPCGGAARAGDGQPHRGRRVEQRAAQRRREVRARAQATSTCSSKLTSPSSVRWTGHLAPITASRSICSSVRVSGIRVTSRNWVG